MADMVQVDLDGVRQMVAQLDRAGADAKRGGKHVTKYANMSWAEHGLLLDTLAAGHHERVFRVMSGAIRELADRTDRAARAITQTAEEFANLDDEGKRQFDSLFAALDAGPMPNFARRYGESLNAASFEDLSEPSDAFTDPELHATTPLFEFDWRHDLLSVSSAVRGAAIYMVGKDPFQEMFNWLSGDWAGFQRCAIVWTQLARAAEGIGRNIAAAGAGSEWVWLGRAANEARGYLLALADAATDFAPVCREAAKRYQDGVTTVRAFSKVVTTAVGEMVDAAVAWLLTRAAMARAPHPMAMLALLGFMFYCAKKFVDAYQYVTKKQTEVLYGYELATAWFKTFDYREISKLRPPALLLSPGSPL